MEKKLNISDVSDDVRKIISYNSNLVNKIGVFGSLARGDFNDKSDIDILIEYAATSDFQPERFLQFCKLCNGVIDSLMKIYGRKVDLVQFENDPSGVLCSDNVNKEVVWI